MMLRGSTGTVVREAPLWIDYRTRIGETVAALARAERAARGTPAADRVKLLRLLKSGQQRSLAGAAALLGYSERQAQRWWRRYVAGGLAALMQVGRPGGGRERLPRDAWPALDAKLRAGALARLRDVQACLRERWGIAYTVSGVSKLFQRHKVKRETGRPHHRQADAARQAAFKKGARGDADGAPDRPAARAR